jgi:hypothetical protein
MKKVLKNLMMALMIVTLSSGITMAQQRGQGGPPPMPDDKQIEKMVEDLVNELSLTTEQEKLVSEKYFTHFDEVNAKMKSGRPDRDEMDKMKSDFQNDIKSVLSKDQQKLFDEYIKKQEANRRGGRGPYRRGGR